MPGTFSPPPQVSDPDMHQGTCVTHVPWCMPGSLTSNFLWSRRRGKTFPAFPAHAQPAILRSWQEVHGSLMVLTHWCLVTKMSCKELESSSEAMNNVCCKWISNGFFVTTTTHLIFNTGRALWTKRSIAYILRKCFSNIAVWYLSRYQTSSISRKTLKNVVKYLDNGIYPLYKIIVP